MKKIPTLDDLRQGRATILDNDQIVWTEHSRSQLGWQYPVCGKSYSPFVTECRDSHIKIETRTSYSPYID